MYSNPSLKPNSQQPSPENYTGRAPYIRSIPSSSKGYSDLATAPNPPHPFREECLTGSGISPDLFAGSIEFVEDSGFWEVHQRLNLPVATQWIHNKPHNFGITAFFKNEDGTDWQAKPETPITAQNGKAQKYQAPKGAGSTAYLPPIDLTTRQAIGQRYGYEIPPTSESFWDWVAAHPEIPLVLTEGGKKALSLLSHGIITIALYGINGGYRVKDPTTGLELLKPEIIATLARFTVPGRPITLAFDQDIATATREKVDRALCKFSTLLENTGCTVTIAQWDRHDGKGVDDLIVNKGISAWETAQTEAIPAAQYRIQRQLAQQVKRKPDLNIGDREFSEVVDQLPKEGLIVLYGGKGTGKSEAIGAMLGNNSWLSSTTLISLGRDQATSWGGVFINDGDTIGTQLLKDGSPVNGASVCIPSLFKVQRIQPHTVIIDETTAHLNFLLTSRLANKDGMRRLLIGEHHRQLQSAKQVILADADISEEAIRYYELLTGQRAFLVRSERQALTYEANVLDCTQNQAIAALHQRFDALEAGKLIYINTDSKAFADSLAQSLELVNLKSLLITSDTSGGELEKSFLSSKGNLIPSLINQGIKVIISSPTIAQGFSIQNHTDRIDSVWGFYKGGSIDAHSIAQSLDRVRAEVPRFVNISKKGMAYSKLSKAQSVNTFLKEFRQTSTVAAQLARDLLTPDATTKSDAIDWQSQNLKMLASLEVRRNQGMGALRDTVMALLRNEGKRVQLIKPLITKAEAQAAGRSLKVASQAIKQAHADAVAQSIDLTETEADRLSNQTDPLTPEQVLSMEKFFLSQFYRTGVDTHLVLFDRNGMTQREIKALERVLTPQLATDRTARTINQNPESPQDWDKAAVQIWLAEVTGFNDLVRSIVSGEIENLTTEVITPIAESVRSHPQEFRMAFGFTKLDTISNQQILGQMLSKVGIKTKRQKRKGFYSVDKARLDLFLRIIDRRKQTDPPLSKLDLNPDGWTASNPIENPSFSPKTDPLYRREIADPPDRIEEMGQTIKLSTAEKAA
jgi:Domain of unknown function (DUF3854)